jgi:hypothetical protein
LWIFDTSNKGKSEGGEKERGKRKEQDQAYNALVKISQLVELEIYQNLILLMRFLIIFFKITNF